jgi:hypothetical protein
MAPRFLTILTGRNVPKIGSRRPSTKRRPRTSRAWSSRREFWSRRLIKRDRRKLDAKLLRQLSRAPRGRAQRWDGGWRGRASAVALSKPAMKYLSNGATNPIHARYYCGGNICLKCALEHTRRQRPRPLQPARRGRLVRDLPSKRPTPPSGV